MINKFLITVLLLITTLCYSQRNLTYAIEYNLQGKPIKEFTTKLAYWVNNKDKFIIETSSGSSTYTIKSEENKSTASGYKFVAFDLVPDKVGELPVLVQVFENKEYGIRIYSQSPNPDLAKVYYQLYD